ncbi:MAG: GNAT family N-acetyltransferase [Vibrio sp.]
MDVIIGGLANGQVIALLEEHLIDMYATSPPESAHALDVDSLKHPNITFFSGWVGEQLCGCLAMKQLTSEHVELKSMRTSHNARNSGVASGLLTHVLDVASARGFRRVSLETGSQEFFKPARNLYEKFGFRYCDPFADYSDDPNSRFMTKDIE